MSSRTWIKIYVDKWLEGTISEESISVRGVWVSLLALAGNGKYGDSGYIMALDGVGFNDKQLAAMLKISLNLWVATKKQLKKTGRIIEQPPKTPSKKNEQPPLVLAIANWNKYQSEYERTSKYRSNATTNTTTNGTAIEDRGKRIEDRKKKVYVQKLFDTFWVEYPKKVNKKKALVAFQQLNMNNGLLDAMIEAVKAQRQSPDWLKDNGQYIPHPTSWLNNHRWEDEISVDIKDQPQGEPHWKAR